MNNVLKKILNTAKDVAEVVAQNSIPGAGILISGVEKLVDKDKTNNMGAVIDIEDGFITALESLKGEEVLDQALLAEAINDLEAAFVKIRASLKK